MLLFGKGTTANLYSHLEYNAKVISAETIARVLDGEAANENNASDETAESAAKKSTGKKQTTKRTSSKSASTEKSKTTEPSTTKKPCGRKKKSETPDGTGESQVSRL